MSLLQLLIEQHAYLIEESVRLRQQADNLMNAIAPHLHSHPTPTPPPVTVQPPIHPTPPVSLFTPLFARHSTPQTFLTPEQVEQVSRIVRFGDIESPVNTSCPISLETFTPDTHVRQLTCRHAFHQNQIDTWFTRNTKCPACRHDFLQDVNPTETAGINELSFVLSSNGSELNELLRMLIPRN